jgi:methionine synthase I (cobalamin-dependent)/5,10-methylenetetrahydrofolate reductase
MSRPPLLDALRQRVVLSDGAMGTMLYSSGIYINQSFDALNLSRPNLVAEIHQQYLDAGSEVLTTNTFGANRLKLQPHGLGHRVGDVVAAGVKIARDVAGDRAWVVGSLGPLGPELLLGRGDEEIADVFREHAGALIEAGVDAIHLETFESLAELLAALDAVRPLGRAPLIASVSTGEDLLTGDGKSPEEAVAAVDDALAEVLGVSCAAGPLACGQALDRMRRAAGPDRLLSAKPNAGIPHRVEGRFLYLATPEYIAEYIKRMLQGRTANLVGSCCGTTPKHTRAIRGAVRMLFPAQSTVVSSAVEERALPVALPERIEELSAFARKVLRRERFVASVEINPPLGDDMAKQIDGAKMLRDAGVDVVNIPDGPRASARMDPMSLAMILKGQVGIESLVHFCCRDRNALAMQSDLLGANALGIHSIVVITGDPPKLGNYPDTTAVFDLDAVGLVKLINQLNQGLDLARNPIRGKTDLFIIVGANPGAIDFDLELERLKAKIAAGGQCIMTQPVYEEALFHRFVRRARDEGVTTPILVGILPLASLRNAEFLTREVPGMQVPEPIIERLRRAGTGPAARKEGVKIAQEALLACAPLAQGVYIMPPFERYEAALEVLEAVDRTARV